MGKHWGNSSGEQRVRTRTVAVRWLSGGACLSLAVLTFGIQGVAGTGSSSGGSAAFTASGAVGPQPLDLTPLMDTAHAFAGVAFTADERALVAFSRSAVETSTKEGASSELNVASAGLKRPSVGSLMAPLESLLASSGYGLRTSPITGSAGEFHWGQDFAAPCGTRVYAADSGVVRAVGWHPWGGGNRVEIDHGNGLITTYNHLEAIAVKKGDSVRVDEIIAKVGTTGSSTGCHLHFETILNGKHVNPQAWSLVPTRQVDPVGPLTMISYEPDASLPASNRAGWAIPVADNLTHIVAGGLNELTVPAAVKAFTPAPAPAPTTATPPTTGTATPAPTTGTPTTGTATPAPTTGTASAPTTGTATPARRRPVRPRRRRRRVRPRRRRRRVRPRRRRVRLRRRRVRLRAADDGYGHAAADDGYGHAAADDGYADDGYADDGYGHDRAVDDPAAHHAAAGRDKVRHSDPVRRSKPGAAASIGACRSNGAERKGSHRRADGRSARRCSPGRPRGPRANDGSRGDDGSSDDDRHKACRDTLHKPSTKP